MFFCVFFFFFFFKQKTAYEIGWCDWSSDVCSSDLHTSVALASANHAAICAPLPAPSHSKTALLEQVITGGVVSTTVTVLEQVLWLPQASVAVKVTVAAPLAPHRSLNPA